MFKKPEKQEDERWGGGGLMRWDVCRPAGKADTISPAGFVLTAEDCKSLATTQNPEVDLPLTSTSRSACKEPEAFAKPAPHR